MAMTFEEYAQKHLGTAGLSFSAMELVRMGWNARASHGNCQGILDTSDHIPDATKMVQGNVVNMGEMSEDGEKYTPAMLIEFASVEDFHAAREAGQCRFTVFGGDV